MILRHLPNSPWFCGLRNDFELDRWDLYRFLPSFESIQVKFYTVGFWSSQLYSSYFPCSTSTSAFPGSVCGTLTGQHSKNMLKFSFNQFHLKIHMNISVYFETGSATTGSAGTATLTTVGTTNTRKYRIKASYFTCTDANRYFNQGFLFHTHRR